MILNILILILGFVILIKGADYFVDGASGIAGHFKISKIIIGLTIVAFGTSAPELAVSIQAMINGSGDIVFGNVIGSNVLNILLIVGISSLFHSLNVKNNTVRKELPLLLLITSLFSILLLDNLADNSLKNVFARNDGFVVIMIFLIFVYYLLNSIRNKKEEEEEDNQEENISILRAIFYVAIGLTGIVIGSDFVVDGATNIAKLIGISERMISLTVIALGTSLPELVTSVTATRKGEYDIAMGNVVGSNIFNICLVVGVPVSIFGTISNLTISMFDIFVMCLATLLLFLFSVGDYKITRKEGLDFITLFIVYYSYVIFG